MARQTNNDGFGLVFVALATVGLWNGGFFMLVYVTFLMVVSVVSLARILTWLIWNLRFRNSRMVQVDTMNGMQFERYVAKLLPSLGFKHISMTEKYDYGVDIIAIKEGVAWGIQVKRYKGLVKAAAGPATVRESPGSRFDSSGNTRRRWLPRRLGLCTEG
jgi:hypothetical protein